MDNTNGMDTEYQNFNVRAFLKERCPGNAFTKVDPRILAPWVLKSLHEFYQQFHKEWDNSKASLLGIGAGPYIHTLISASPYVGQIYHTDYLEDCRKEVLLWKNKDPDAYDWSPYFQFVVNTLEGQVGADVIVQRQELVRSKIKDSVFLDITSSDIKLPSCPGSFDIVYTGFCIESLASSLEEYKGFIKNVYDLLKPNGYFFMFAYVGCTVFIVNGVKYPTYPITIEEISATLRELGFTIHYVESIKRNHGNGVTYYSDEQYYSRFIAQRNN